MRRGVRHQHDTVFVVYDGIQGLDLVGPWEVFHGANAVLDDRDSTAPRYRLSVVDPCGDGVVTESGLEIATAAIPGSSRPGTLVIPGGFGARAASDDPAMIAAVARLGARCERIVTVCTGVVVAAAAGLCDGRRVATHWARAAWVARRFPNVTVDTDPIFVRDGRLWSSAGVTAGIDLALAVVEEDHGADVAQVVARWLVMFLRRPGGQSQFAIPVWADRADSEPVRAAQDLIDSSPADDHRVAVLAAKVGMSERHFARCFTQQTGVSPGHYVAAVRLEAARRHLESTRDTVDVIARRCGFGTAESMRRTFARHLGVSPDQYRTRFRSST